MYLLVQPISEIVRCREETSEKRLQFVQPKCINVHVCQHTPVHVCKRTYIQKGSIGKQLESVKCLSKSSSNLWI